MVERTAIEAMVRKIGAAFDPDRVILFGSYAYGRPDDESDVDLVVILPFEGRRSAKAVEIWLAARPSFPVDVLVRKPGELERDRDFYDPFARDVLERGVVLYERRR